MEFAPLLTPHQERKAIARRLEENKIVDFAARKRETAWSEMSGGEHFVQIYENDAVFMDALECFVGGGLLAGDATIVIATQAHLFDLEARLIENGVELAVARSQDQYISLIAEETLPKFMQKGSPNEALFTALIVDILARAQRNGRKVRAFGEMVAILWACGNSAATVRLEHLWNQQCKQHSLSLLCAYPKDGFTSNAAESIANICSMHSHVIT